MKIHQIIMIQKKNHLKRITKIEKCKIFLIKIKEYREKKKKSHLYIE